MPEEVCRLLEERAAVRGDGTTIGGLVDTAYGANQLRGSQYGVVDRPSELGIVPAQPIEEPAERARRRLLAPVDRASHNPVRNPDVDRRVAGIADDDIGQIHPESLQPAEQAARQLIGPAPILVPTDAAIDLGNNPRDAQGHRPIGS
jgi:hypothetical protein